MALSGLFWTSLQASNRDKEIKESFTKLFTKLKIDSFNFKSSFVTFQGLKYIKN